MSDVEGIVSTAGRYGNTIVETQELADQYEAWITKGMTERSYAQKEAACLATIEQLLGITLIRQFRVGPYRIDGYCEETNTAYEADEQQHKYQKSEDKEREDYIKAELGCSFVRIKV